MRGGMIKIMIICANIVLIAVLLSGCGIFQVEFGDDSPETNYSTQFDSPFRPPQDQVVVTREKDLDSQVVVTLMRYSRLIGELNEQALDSEFRKLEKAVKERPSPRGRLKLAVLLSMPASSFYDEKRAETILKAVLQESEGRTPALKEYAHMLLTTLKQRSSFQNMYEDLHKKLKKERSERKQLQQQVEALKSIEKSITTRQNK